MNLSDQDVVTIEHATVIQERMSKVLEKAYPNEGVSSIVTNHFDPEAMKEELLEIFTPKAFLKLFETEMGKGVLIGAFYQQYIHSQESE